MRKVTDTHEWIETDGTLHTVGITNEARSELGEIVYIELPKVGLKVDIDDEICILESTKAAIDLYSPLSGTVVEVNDALKENVNLLNHFPEDAGWLYKVKSEETTQ